MSSRSITRLSIKQSFLKTYYILQFHSFLLCYVGFNSQKIIIFVKASTLSSMPYCDLPDFKISRKKPKFPIFHPLIVNYFIKDNNILGQQPQGRGRHCRSWSSGTNVRSRWRGWLLLVPAETLCSKDLDYWTGCINLYLVFLTWNIAIASSDFVDVLEFNFDFVMKLCMYFNLCNHWVST